MNKKRPIKDWFLFGICLLISALMAVGSFAWFWYVDDNDAIECRQPKSQQLWDIDSAWLGAAKVQRRLYSQRSHWSEGGICYQLAPDDALLQEWQGRLQLKGYPAADAPVGLPPVLVFLGLDEDGATVYLSDRIFYFQRPGSARTYLSPMVIRYAGGELVFIARRIEFPGPDFPAPEGATELTVAHPELVMGEDEVAAILYRAPGRASDNWPETLRKDPRWAVSVLLDVVSDLLFICLLANGLQLMLTGWPWGAGQWLAWFAWPVVVLALPSMLLGGAILLPAIPFLVLFSALLLIPFNLLRRLRR